MPEGFRYEADIYSRDQFFNEKEGRFGGEVLSLTRFLYEVAERRGDTLIVRNAFDVRRPTGERIFSVQRLYGVDRRTLHRWLLRSGDLVRCGAAERAER